MARTNPEIKVRFQRIFEWVRPPYVCGWPNFEQADYPEGIFYGHYQLTGAVTEWRDLTYDDLDRPVENPMRAWFTHAHDYARRNGFQHGFPNFEQANYNDGRGNVFGVHLIQAGTAQFQDIPARDLGLGTGATNPELHTMDEWFWAAARWATSHGFVAGIPTGHCADYHDGNGWVCGVFLFPQGTAMWVDVEGSQIGMPSHPPAMQTPPPPLPTGTLTVTLTSETGFVLVSTTSNPESWEGRDARITNIKNPNDQEIILSHTDSHHTTVPGVRIPAGGRVAGDFVGMGVEGTWQAQLTRVVGGMPKSIKLEIDWQALA